MEKKNIVAVLHRAIPVEGCKTDTLTYLVSEGETVASVLGWANDKCQGTAAMVALEITGADKLVATNE